MPTETWLISFSRVLYRSSTQRLARALVVLALLGITVVAGLFAAVRQSPEQLAEQGTGAFDFSLAVGPNMLPGHGLPTGSDEALRTAGATTWAFVITSTVQFRGQSLPSAVLEADWPSAPMGEAYELVSGRWPSAPNEAAVTPDIAKAAPTGTLTGADGAMSLEIVGTVVDNGYLPGQHVLAGQGTWEGVSPDIAKRFPDLIGVLTVYWSGGDPARTVEALAAAWAPSMGEPAEVLSGDLMYGFSSRSEILERHRRTLADSPALGLPAVAGVAALAGAAVAALNIRWRIRLVEQCVRLGILRRHAQAALLLSGLASIIVGVLGGALLGMVALLPGRAVLATRAQTVLSPTQPEWRVWAWSATVVCTAYLLVGGLASLLRRPTALPSDRATGPRRATWSTIAWLSSAVSATAALVLAPQARTETDIALVMVLLALAAGGLTPGLISWLSARPSHHPVRVLARRALAGEGVRNRVLGALAAALVCVLVSGMTWWTSMNASLNDSTSANLPPGMVAIESNGELPPGLIQEFEDFTGLTDPVRVSLIETTSVSVPGVLRSAATPDDLARLTGNKLTADEVTALGNGYVMTGHTTKSVNITNADLMINLPATQMPVPEEFGAAGFILLTEAEQMGLVPVSGRDNYYYPSVDEDQLARVKSAADELGYSPTLIVWHRPQDVLPIALSAQVAMGGLGLVVLLLTAAGSFGQARGMRPVLAVARAIGLDRLWLVRVLREQALITFGSAFATAALSQGVLLAVLSTLSPLTVVTPWGAIGTVALICICGLLLAPRLALTQLKATEREL